MSYKMERVVSHGREIDLRDWTFPYGDEDPCSLADILMKGCVARVTEVLRQQFEDDPPKLTLPFGWRRSDGRGGPCPDDPVTLHVNLQLGSDEEGVTYACSLEGAVDDVIELYEIDGKIDDPKGRETCAMVAARLRELANKLDDVCKT
jgi:hypothetical protein